MLNKILIVNDDYNILSLLYEILNEKGYIINVAKNGADALENIGKDIPNIVIADLKMSNMNAIEMAAKIHSNPRLNHLPIIMLIEKYDEQTVIESLKNGINDFIVKPIREEELLAKIKLILFKAHKGIDTNPLTRLPGNNSIKEYIDKVILLKKSFAVCFLDIDNFKSFNDKYGFERGDKAIRLCAQIINDVLKKHYREDDFVGHIGGDDFVVIINPERMKLVCDEIIYEFDKNITSLYDEEDLHNGYIISKNRLDQTAKFPIMTISIGIVSNEKRQILHSVQVSEIGNELKKFAKSVGKSNYVIDKREIDKPIVEVKKQSFNLDANADFSLFIDDIVPVFSDVKKYLKEKRQTAMLYLDIVSTENTDHEEIDEWKEVLEDISNIFINSRDQFMRKSDTVSIYNNKKDKIFIFLSPPRRKQKINIDDIEIIIQKIKVYFEKNHDNFNKKFDIVFGYSIFSFPF